MKRFIIFALLFNLIAVDAGRGTKEEQKAVESVIETVSSDVIHILNDEELSKAEKLKKLEAVIEPYFDFSTMAKLSIGRRWKNLTEQEKEEYVALFKQRIMNQYVARLLDLKMSGWDTEKIDISRKGTEYIVRVNTVVNQAIEPDLEIQWVLAGADVQELKCIDVYIEGISLLVNLQRELRNLLRREKNNIENFLRFLADEVKKIR
ncbi:MAG: ABC transporter substrate-binding protein [Bdellovibrionales bacterium]|nr:ABC transporter substrate-binding protein [Bdellovibrionales bacterium]